MKTKPKTSLIKQKITYFRRKANASKRVLPDYLIIGAQKAGTTALNSYLNLHPKVVPALKKEIKYFDCNFNRSELWYRSFFPLASEMEEGKLTGEASPSYLYDPHAAKRSFEMLPEVKIIVLLRNPIDRAYSGHNLHVKKGNEQLPFEEAIALEDERVEGEEEKIIADPTYSLHRYRLYSYLHRGLYARQLKRWMEVYPKEQFLVLESDRFLNETKSVYGEVLSFLGLAPYDLQDYKKVNARSYESEMSAEMRAQLREYFAPHNEELFELLGEEFDWD